MCKYIDFIINKNLHKHHLPRYLKNLKTKLFVKIENIL